MVKFLKCNHCGNIVEVIQDAGVKIQCCNEDMAELVANTTDAATEKHVPVAEIKDGKLHAKVGSVPHPMEEKHFIQWIAFANENGIKKVFLKPGEDAVAEICANFKGDIYEYCNLHGLWKTEVK